MERNELKIVLAPRRLQTFPSHCLGALAINAPSIRRSHPIPHISVLKAVRNRTTFLPARSSIADRRLK